MPTLSIENIAMLKVENQSLFSNLRAALNLAPEVLEAFVLNVVKKLQVYS